MITSATSFFAVQNTEISILLARSFLLRLPSHTLEKKNSAHLSCIMQRRVLVASSASLSTCQVYSLLTDVATWSLRGLIHKMYISWSVLRACRHCYRCWGGSLHLCMRITHTRRIYIYIYERQRDFSHARQRHYCNFVGGNDEKWLVKRLTASLIGHRSFPLCLKYSLELLNRSRMWNITIVTLEWAK